MISLLKPIAAVFRVLTTKTPWRGITLKYREMQRKIRRWRGIRQKCEIKLIKKRQARKESRGDVIGSPPRREWLVHLSMAAEMAASAVK